MRVQNSHNLPTCIFSKRAIFTKATSKTISLNRRVYSNARIPAYFSGPSEYHKGFRRGGPRPTKLNNLQQFGVGKILGVFIGHKFTLLFNFKY